MAMPSWFPSGQRAVTSSAMRILPTGAYVSYTASNFEATCRFYEDVLGCERTEEWDRDDERGAYYDLEGISLVEILGFSRDGPTFTTPDTDSFVVVVTVVDAQAALEVVRGRGADTVESLTEEAWGRYFGVRDPDGVSIYFLDRRPRGD
jgi:predicted enzyme related to lactoylglutathione lyase